MLYFFLNAWKAQYGWWKILLLYTKAIDVLDVAGLLSSLGILSGVFQRRCTQLDFTCQPGCPPNDLMWGHLAAPASAGFMADRLQVT